MPLSIPIPAESPGTIEYHWRPGKQHCIVFVCLARQMLASISLMVLVERGWWSIVSVAAAVGRVKRTSRSLSLSLVGIGTWRRVRVSLTPIRRHGHERTNERAWTHTSCLSIRPYRAVFVLASRCLKNVGIPVCANSSLLWTVYTGYKRACALARLPVRSYTCQVARHVRAYTIVILFLPFFFHLGAKRDALARATKTISSLSSPPRCSEGKKSQNLWRQNFRDSTRVISSCVFFKISFTTDHSPR